MISSTEDDTIKCKLSFLNFNYGEYERGADCILNIKLVIGIVDQVVDKYLIKNTGSDADILKGPNKK